MKYKVGDMIVVNTETRPDGKKRVLIREPQEDWTLGSQAFQIAAKHINDETYSLIIEDDMIGWTVGEFQIQHQRFAAAFKGKKFFDVTEAFIVKKKA